MKVSAVGVNEDGLKRLILELDEYQEKIQAVYRSLEDCQMEALKGLNDDAASAFLEKYREVGHCFEIVKSNLQTYKDDFQTVIRRYQQTSHDSVDLFEEAKRKIPDNG